MTVMEKPNVTRHAKHRSRERLGLPKKAVERNAKAALQEGVTREETRGSLRKYMDWLYHRDNCEANQLRIYNGYVYVFCGPVLVTVFQVAYEHRKAARFAQQKKGEITNG